MVKRALVDFAREAGFASVGICRPDAVDLRAKLDAFVEAGYHGQMSWMAERMAWRASPAALWPEAKSVVMLAESYTPDGDPLAALEARERGVISVYAQGRDYHDVVKKRLKRVGRWLIEQVPGAEIKVFVDTAPVMEKPLAQAAGLGWQGKHTNLLGRELGSWFFLGAIFTTVELEPDRAEVSHCGSCTACLDICPTEAFPGPYQLDARRCISYLTIEHKGPVELELRAKMGNRIYGCDDCLAVCPWNKFAAVSADLKLAAQEGRALPSLADMLCLDDAAFRRYFSGSPVKRTGYIRFTRNCLIAAGNAGDAGLMPVIRPYLTHADSRLRAMAVWAAAHYMTPDELAGLRPDNEPDDAVRAEWQTALSQAD